jgi:hypothetical protein
MRKSQTTSDNPPSDILSSIKKPATLFDVIRNLGYSGNSCYEIVNAVERWIPPEHDTNSYQWNKCIKTMKENLW